MSDCASVLESNLQHYSTLTSGTVVSINYRGETFKFDVLEIKGDAQSARDAQRKACATAELRSRSMSSSGSTSSMTIQGGRGDPVFDALAAVEACGVAGKRGGKGREGEPLRWGRVQDCDVAFELLKARDKLEEEERENTEADDSNADKKHDASLII